MCTIAQWGEAMKRDVKTKQIEKSLNKLGSLAADATDTLIKANEATEAIAAKLISIQNEIEQIYTTLEEPLLLYDYEKDK